MKTVLGIVAHQLCPPTCLMRRWPPLAFGAVLLVFSGCTGGRQASSRPSQGKQVFTLTYEAGASWIPDASPSAQGLGPHVAFMQGHFEAGLLAANGPLRDAVEGLYVFDTNDPSVVRSIAATDPAVADGTLAVRAVEPWLLMMTQLGRPLPAGAEVYVVEVGPGPAWDPGRSMEQQALGEHMDYVGRLFKSGAVLAGGPIPGTDRGRYIVAMASATSARAFVASDPGVSSGVLDARVRRWDVGARHDL